MFESPFWLGLSILRVFCKKISMTFSIEPQRNIEDDLGALDGWTWTGGCKWGPTHCGGCFYGISSGLWETQPEKNFPPQTLTSTIFQPDS